MIVTEMTPERLLREALLIFRDCRLLLLVRRPANCTDTGKFAGRGVQLGRAEVIVELEVP